MALHHTSKTSPMKPRIASSVCGLVGLFGTLVLEDPEVLALDTAAEVLAGTEV